MENQTKSSEKNTEKPKCPPGQHKMKPVGGGFLVQLYECEICGETEDDYGFCHG